MSDQTPLPTQTPNVVIRNPRARQIAYDVFGIASLAVAVVIGVDLASDAFDLIAYTKPALAGLGILGAGLGFTARQNTPSV